MAVTRATSWEKEILASDLPSRTRHLALTLACHMNAAGESCFPGIKRLAREMRVSERCVKEHIARLKTDGWIEVTARSGGRGNGRKTNDYVATWPALTRGTGVPDVNLHGANLDAYMGNPSAPNIYDEDARKEDARKEDASNNSRIGGDPAIRAIFDYWQEQSGHTRAAYSDTRRKKIRSRLKHFTPDDLKRAIGAACADEFYKNNNYDWIETILKTDEAVERHLAHAQNGNRRIKTAEDRLAEFTESRVRAAQGI